MLLENVDQIVQYLESPREFDRPPFWQTLQNRVTIGQLIAAFARVNALHGKRQETFFRPDDRSLQVEIGARSVENADGHIQRIFRRVRQVLFQQMAGEGGGGGGRSKNLKSTDCRDVMGVERWLEWSQIVSKFANLAKFVLWVVSGLVGWVQHTPRYVAY